MSYEPPHARDWFIFGHRVDDPNLVDISNGDSDVLIGVPRELAEKIIELRAKTVRRLYPEYHS